MKLRRNLLRFAPDVAARFGITANKAEELTADELALDAGVDAEQGPDVDEGAGSGPSDR